MTAPMVSICVPAYEQVVYLERTLRSILEQSFQDHETIVSDDSTSDRVEQLVRRHEEGFRGRLTYVRNRPAKGSPENWNAAVALARGRYIKMMHHDEWFASADGLERFVRTAESEQAGFVFSSVITHVERDGRSWELHPTDDEVDRLRRTPELIMLGNVIGPPSATLYRRDLGLQYDRRFVYVVDMAFYIAAFKRAGRVARIPEALIHAVSDAAHNVTNRCHVPEIELRENIMLFEEHEAHIPREQLHRFKRSLFGLFVRYGIDTLEKLKAYHPMPERAARYRPLIWKVKAFQFRERFLRGRRTIQGG